MSIIHVNHIQSNCRKRFTNLIDMTDVKTENPEERDNFFLSRALAAFSIAALAKVDDAAAAESVVDETHDDGIDGFYFDRVEHVGYLVQSKWVKNGVNTVDLGSVLKFIKGVHDFLSGVTSLLGKKMQAKQQDISELLDDSQATFVLVVAYTGKQSLATEVREPIDQALSELNDDGEFVSFRELKQKELHDVVAQTALGDDVNIEVMLHEWGKYENPYKVYYGQVAVSDITGWGKYGDHLYHKTYGDLRAAQM